MDKKLEDIFKFLFGQKNLPAIAGVIVVTALAILVATQILLPDIKNLKDIYSNRSANQTKLVELQEKKKKMELEAKAEKQEIQQVPSKLYKSLNANLPIETSSVDFVSTVINMLGRTNNNIMDISYTIDTINATEKAKIPANVSVIELVMTLSSSYTAFQDFIYELYGYDYIATIKSLKMVPLQENKNILEINLTLWLYVAK